MREVYERPAFRDIARQLVDAGLEWEYGPDTTKCVVCDATIRAEDPAIIACYRDAPGEQITALAFCPRLPCRGFSRLDVSLDEALEYSEETWEAIRARYRNYLLARIRNERRYTADGSRVLATYKDLLLQARYNWSGGVPLEEIARLSGFSAVEVAGFIAERATRKPLSFAYKVMFARNERPETDGLAGVDYPMVGHLETIFAAGGAEAVDEILLS